MGGNGLDDGNVDWVALDGAEKSVGGEVLSASMGVAVIGTLVFGVLANALLLPLKKDWSSRDSRKSLVRARSRTIDCT